MAKLCLDYAAMFKNAGEEIERLEELVYYHKVADITWEEYATAKEKACDALVVLLKARTEQVNELTATLEAGKELIRQSDCWSYEGGIASCEILIATEKLGEQCAWCDLRDALKACDRGRDDG